MLDVLFLYKCTYLCCSMSLILNIETATKNCSVSLAESGKVIAIKELNDGNYSHAEKLHVFINEVLKVAKKSMKDVDAVAVSKGPGSFTGLRIGVSSVKGLCYALNIPLISVDTLKALATQLNIDSGFVVSMLDARRMEVYSAVFDIKNNLIRAIEAQILNEDSFADYLKNNEVYFIGDGVPKTKEIITHKNAVFIDDKLPSANEMAQLSFDKFQKKIFEDVAYFEPFYLKDFVVTTKKKK
jgi:tRNA threonylcarbamoyladenosine biosynthesis protein TsaB